MSKKADQVKSGYAELEATERQDVIRFINDFESATYDRKRSLTESIEKVSNKSVGPRSTNTCPCCGR